MRTRTITAVGCAFLLGLAAAASAQPRHEHRAGALADLLGLGAEQVSAIEQENAGFAATCGPLAEKLDAVRGDIEQAIAAGDRSRLQALLLAEWEANAAVRKEAAAHYERLIAILTPGQAEKLRLVREAVSLASREPRFLEDSGLAPGHAAGERVRHTRPHAGAERERVSHQR